MRCASKTDIAAVLPTTGRESAPALTSAGGLRNSTLRRAISEPSARVKVKAK